MRHKFARPYLYKEIAAAQRCWPSQLDPDYDTDIDFSDIIFQIFGLKRQHLVIGMAAWIDSNAQWLQTEAIVVPSHLLPGSCVAHVFVHAPDDVEHHLRANPKLPEIRHASLALLLQQLHKNTPEHQYSFVDELVFELNAISWHPPQAYAALVDAIDGFVENAHNWLTSHPTILQAQSLQPLHRRHG